MKFPEPTAFELERWVLQDKLRPCLYGVAGPCFHPRCLEGHIHTVRARYYVQAYRGPRIDPSYDNP